MIYTSSYKNFNSEKYETISISGDRGAKAYYVGSYYSKLMPKKSFWEVWEKNRGIYSEEMNNKYYVLEYYRQVLKQLDPEEVYKELNNSVLLCYEEADEFCHRHIVAEWLQLLLGLNIFEVKIQDGEICEVERPKYIRKYLVEAMRKSNDMLGFTSVRAFYLYNKSLEYRVMSNDVEINPIMRDIYKEQADVYIRNAGILETNAIKKVKKRIKK